MNRYLAFIIAVLSGAEMQAFELAPRLVVNLVVDQLRTDYLDYFSPLYSPDGFKKLMQEGRVYEAASYPFTPVDKASAMATIATGTTPYYHGIIANRWLDRNTLRPTFCVDDMKHFASPHRLTTSTLGDEMKVNSQGAAIVWSIAEQRECAILSAGHAADGALWIDEKNGRWRGSTYYTATLPAWIKSYASAESHVIKNKQLTNDAIIDLALQTVTSTAMGRDEVSDLLSVTLSAASPTGSMTNWQTTMEPVYMQIDKAIARLLTGVTQALGTEHVMFVVTSTGYVDEAAANLSAYRIPTGTFYINRTANLLNMFLSAIYGQGRYVEACFRNEVYLNHKLIEQKNISLAEMLQRSQDFLVQNAGVAEVYTSERLLRGNNDILKRRNGFHPTLSGDIIIEVAPGWQLVNEETQESISTRASFIPFPIIIYGAGTKSERVTLPVSVDRIAPTIARSIRIRAPNACTAEPLF